MCTTCGCGTGEARVEGKALAEPGNRHEGNGGNPPPKPLVNDQGQGHSGMVYSAVTALGGHAHHHPGGRQHAHGHEHGTGHDHRHDSLHEHSLGQAATSVSTTQSRLVQIERDLLAKNDGYAAANRSRFEEQGIFALNLVSSPGSGKTTLLCRTVEALRGELSIAVIEGDQQTSRDAERIRATGAPVSMKPKSSTTRQKPCPSGSTCARCPSSTTGCSRKRTVSSTLRSCSTWLCLRLCSSACGTVPSGLGSQRRRPCALTRQDRLHGGSAPAQEGLEL